MYLVYGGTFNPPTKAHYEIAKKLCEKYNAKLAFCPVGDSYNKPEIISFTHRYNMVKIIASKLNATVLDFENNTKFLGTYELLNSIKEEDIYFIIGADNLENIHNWINYEKLVKEYKFIVITRGDVNCLDLIKKTKHEDHFIVEKFNFVMSSSDYRNNKNDEIIDSDVLKYIKNNKLYEVM